VRRTAPEGLGERETGVYSPGKKIKEKLPVYIMKITSSERPG
jgi:hypothetical protein